MNMKHEFTDTYNPSSAEWRSLDGFILFPGYTRRLLDSSLFIKKKKIRKLNQIDNPQGGKAHGGLQGPSFQSSHLAPRLT